MDIKKLNEEMRQLLEREESQEFKDFMQAQRDRETKSLQNKRQEYVDDAINYNKWAKHNAEQGRDSEYDERRAQPRTDR